MGNEDRTVGLQHEVVTTRDDRGTAGFQETITGELDAFPSAEEGVRRMLSNQSLTECHHIAPKPLLDVSRLSETHSPRMNRANRPGVVNALVCSANQPGVIVVTGIEVVRANHHLRSFLSRHFFLPEKIYVVAT